MRRAHASITLIESGFLALMTTLAEIKAILENKEKSSMSAFCFHFRFLLINKEFGCALFIKERVRNVVCVS